MPLSGTPAEAFFREEQCKTYGAENEADESVELHHSVLGLQSQSCLLRLARVPNDPTNL